MIAVQAAYLRAQKVGPVLGLYTHVQVAVDEYIHINSTRESANRFHWNINCVKMNVFRNEKNKSIVYIVYTIFFNQQTVCRLKLL